MFFKSANVTGLKFEPWSAESIINTSVAEINNSKLSKYLKNFKDNSGMKYSKYNLEFFGVCKKCKNK